MNTLLNILRSATAAALAAVCLVPLASQAQDAEIKMFAPVNGQRVGVGGFGWFVDLAIDFESHAGGLSGDSLTHCNEWLQAAMGHKMNV